MSNKIISQFIKSYTEYKTLTEKAVDQLNEEQLRTVNAADSNSIAVIMKHMSGNLISRFTDFLTTDGEKEWRNRDGEFEEDAASKEEILAYWNKGFDVLKNSLESLNDEDLDKTVYIRNEALTVIQALFRSLTHYASHAGQIVVLAKMMKGEEWKTLSVPKKRSS